MYNSIASGILAILDKDLKKIDVILSVTNDEIDDFNNSGGKAIVETLKNGLLIEQTNKVIILEYKEKQFIIKYNILASDDEFNDVSFEIIKVAISELF